MAQTERHEYVFIVKEGADGTPWIMLEPRRGSLSCLGDGFLGFDLKPGTSLSGAREVADFLQRRIAGVSHTRFEPQDHAPA